MVDNEATAPARTVKTEKTPLVLPISVRFGGVKPVAWPRRLLLDSHVRCTAHGEIIVRILLESSFRLSTLHPNPRCFRDLSGAWLDASVYVRMLIFPNHP
jgi:hypothetical protein